ncbi:hypothetical protein AVEN_146795-1 [Araneus ventricosus]|uniref:Uncharacterized protein n=1 Tax=Araneus ventricosus TaxID=182803 RepID=A0A4Y2D913_ARAVE|nr:hypothetical protein AVEN_146795-1 [Araneus ventricosus]
MFTWSALEPVVVIDSTMKFVDYLNVIVDQLYPLIASVFRTAMDCSSKTSTLMQGLNLHDFRNMTQSSGYCPGHQIPLILFQSGICELSWNVSYDSSPCNLATHLQTCAWIFGLPPERYQKLIEPISAVLKLLCNLNVGLQVFSLIFLLFSVSAT